MSFFTWPPVIATSLSPGLSSTFVLTDGSRALTGNWAAGAFSATFNSVVVGSAANRISGLSTIINTGTLTLPTSTDTLVGRATTDTLTNKSISGATNTLTAIGDGSLSSSYVLADGSRALTGNWAAGAFSATFNSVAVGSASKAITSVRTISADTGGGQTFNVNGTDTWLTSDSTRSITIGALGTGVQRLNARNSASSSLILSNNTSNGVFTIVTDNNNNTLSISASTVGTGASLQLRGSAQTNADYLQLFGTSAETFRVTGAGEVLAMVGNLVVNTAGKGLQIKEGSNARMGTATLNGTTAVVVSNTSITASTRIFLSTQLGAGTVGHPYVSATSVGTSFSIKSTNAADTSTVSYLLIEAN